MKKRGRKRIGRPISITLTPEQIKWLRARVPPGETLTATVRALIQMLIEVEIKEKT